MKKNNVKLDINFLVELTFVLLNTFCQEHEMNYIISENIQSRFFSKHVLFQVRHYVMRPTLSLPQSQLSLDFTGPDSEILLLSLFVLAYPIQTH